MKYLLDTCIIIDHLRKRNPIHKKWIESGAGISSITYAELFRGAEMSNKPQKNKKLIDDLLTLLNIKVIDLSLETIKIFAKESAQLSKKGTKVDHFDCLIAATALQKSASLVTYNVKHFSRFKNLKVVS
jgi:tRNA(fMet)-specific endonuclease VapC